MRPLILRAFPIGSLGSFIVLSALGGCEAPAGKPMIAPTQVDRLVRAYPDLESGRFATIADFEDPRHLEIIGMKRVSKEAGYTLDSDQGRSNTGGGCLAFTVGAGDALVINNAVARKWYMRRDWSGYDLLLMSLHSPRPDLAVELTVTGGPRSERFWVTTTIRLKPGWNLTRLDLAGMGEHIPLHNVNEIRLSVSGATEPVTLLLDDMILTVNRKTVLGAPEDSESGLYAQHIGRRWKIGARQPGDFELTFANGQIVAWYNLAADPERLRNLVWGTALGPTFVSRSGRGLGPRVSVRSKIVELSPVRAVISSQWRFAEDSPGSGEGGTDQESQDWTYTIYPTGQVYVRVDSPTQGSLPSHWGLAASVAASAESDLQARVTKRAEEKRPTGLPTYASARMTSGDALLLYVVDDVGGSMRMEQSAQRPGGSSGSSDQTSFIAFPPVDAPARTHWACHLLVTSSSKVDDREIVARAFGYARPVLPHLELGSFVSVEPGGAGDSGFDPGSGCFVIAPDRGRVRLILDGTQQPYFSPAFRVLNSARRDARVYVDHLIFDHAALDADGNVVFQLPFTVDRRVMVEVLFPQPS